MKSGSKFSLVDAIALAVITIAAIGFVGYLFLPRLPSDSRPAPMMQSNTQVRGIHQTMVMYSQGNNQYFPGFDSAGNVVDATVEHRYKLLLDNNYFTGEYAISPYEPKTLWTTGPVTSDNYSFAMLDIDVFNGRATEWRETWNAEAAVMSDRNIGKDADAQVESVHNNRPGEWHGTVGWNDSHVTFETSHLLLETRYGSGTLNKNDNLFDAPTTDDALMIYSGD